MANSDKCKDRVTRKGLEWSHCQVCNGRRVAGRDCAGEETHTAEEMKEAGY